MREKDVPRLIEGTSDPAFAVDAQGTIVAWNKGAEALCGLSAARAVGRACASIIQGADDDGPVCSRDCAVQRGQARRQPPRNFDLKMPTVRGAEWCNVSVVLAEVHGSAAPQAIHIVRSIEAGRRLEASVREFVRTTAGLSADEARVRIRAGPAPPSESPLSRRETEVLRHIAGGGTSIDVAGELHIGKTTVNNHVQSILRKLNSHSRLEAIRRAEHAGLI